MLADLTNKHGANADRKARRSPSVTAVEPQRITGLDQNGQFAVTVCSMTPAEAEEELATMRKRVGAIVQGIAVWASKSVSTTQMNVIQGHVDAILVQASQTQALVTQAGQVVSHAQACGPKPPTTTCPASNLRDTSLFAAPNQMETDGDDTAAPTRRLMVPATAQPTSHVTAKSVPSFRDEPAQQPLGPRGRTRAASNWPPSEACVVVCVEFKRQRLERFRAPMPLEPGVHVLVPGDRGCDCGLVVHCAIWDPTIGNIDRTTLRSMDDTPLDLFSLHDKFLDIIREASPEEVEQLYGEQASKERLALKTCRELVRMQGLPMDVIDCEYQFDGMKVTFFFDAGHTIDFRRLNRELFSIFNARIWLQNINTAVVNVGPQKASLRHLSPTVLPQE